MRVPSWENLRLERAGAVATVVIDRAAKRNALTIGMWQSLQGICESLAADPELRAVVVTGDGPSFCAGADISALSEDDALMKTAVFGAEEALRSLPVPTIAKIRGHCMGGGNQIAVACDLRICDDTAVFGIPPAKLSVVYPANSTRTLVALIGPSAAKRLIYTALPVSAAEALRLRLVDEVCLPGELDAVVDALVATMLPLAPLSQTAAKQLINEVSLGGDGENLYGQWYAEWQRSPDGVEGPRSFLERRPPNFSWRRPAG